MGDVKISKAELVLLSAAIDKIVSSEVLEKVITETLPKIDDLTDSNKIYQGKVSVLFVDMRGSTKLPHEFNKEQLVKIYRSYIRTVVQAIRYSGGFVRDFMGDGILAIFVDDEEGKSEDKAVRAARYIATTIDKILNPILDRNFKHRISCGIGIHTGEVTLSKVGMKGKEQKDGDENEFGIVWIGNSTNLACKYSGAVKKETIFISSSTYAELSDVEEKDNWLEYTVEKGDNILKGYIAKNYYLKIDEDISACVAEENEDYVSVEKKMQKLYNEHLLSISQKAEGLGYKESELQNKEQIIKKQEEALRQKNINLNNREKVLKEKEYEFYCKVLSSGHCKSEYVKIMGVDFWEENLNNAILTAAEIGKARKNVMQEISCYMVSIYEYLEMYDKAYDFLVAQAEGYSWINVSCTKKVSIKAKRNRALKDAINKRLRDNTISKYNKKDFEELKRWLDTVPTV